ELRNGKRLLREQVLTAPELILAVGKRSLRFLELCSRLGAIELDEHISFTHDIALFEADRDDGVRRLRGHVDGLACTRRTDGFDLYAERAHHRGGRDDRNVFGTAGCTSGFIHRPGTRRERQKSTKNDDSKRGTGTACRNHPRMLTRLDAK